MTVPGNIEALMLGGGGYQIERSLRFNSADSAYLGKVIGAGGGTTKNAVSFWVKRSALGTSQGLFQGRQDASNQQYIYFTTSNTLEIGIIAGGTYVLQKTTSAVYRDTSAWYHVFFYQDNTLATAEDRYQLYINGARVTAWSTNTNTATQSNAYYFGSNVQHYIGALGAASILDGYLTEFHFVYQPTTTPLVGDFGETDTITGVWKPKKYAGTYGTNGFYLKFADNSGTTSTTLGKDSSGNGNNWTPNNFSVTAGSGNDSLIDTPTPYADGGNGRGNYCTLNPLSFGPSNADMIDGNLQFNQPTATTGNAKGTIAVSSGKWYWEVTPQTTTAANVAGGILGAAETSTSAQPGNYATGYSYLQTGEKRNNSVSATYGASYGANDVIGTALDLDAGTLVFYKNGVSQGTAFSGLSGTFVPAIGDASTGSSSQLVCNFGQRSFSYTPPAGFLALNTQNLPEPSIKKPSSYMDTLLWTGDGSQTRSLTGLNFQPDLVWMKLRSSTIQDNQLYDAVRGAGGGKCLATNTTAAEGTVNSFPDSDYGYLSSFDSAGFSVNDGAVATTGGYVNFSGRTYVAWCWDESVTPGFDIVTYTGDGTTSANRLIDHSLGVKPDFIITKKRSSGTTDYGWSCWHKDLGGNYGIWLHVSNGRNANMWTGYSNFSATKFTPPDLSYGNETSQTYVNYLWSEVAGFSKFGSYTGNGSADGPFVFCGFRPKWVLAKRSDASAYNWFIFDAARSPENVSDEWLLPNGSNAEQAQVVADMVSNGFKIRSSLSEFNIAGGTYIFAAFAESPFKYSLAR